MRIRPQGVTPERFYRGSTVLTTTLSHVEWVGGLVPVLSGFPIEVGDQSQEGEADRRDDPAESAGAGG
jgi:hypothetical protein